MFISEMDDIGALFDNKDDVGNIFSCYLIPSCLHQKSIVKTQSELGHLSDCISILLYINIDVSDLCHVARFTLNPVF